MSKVKQLKLDEQLTALKEDFGMLAEKLSEHENIADSINNTYRKIHNLKSNLFLIDHNASLKMLYLIENHFNRLRVGEAELSKDMLILFLSCSEWIREDILEGSTREDLYEELIDDLKKMKFSGRRKALRNLNLNAEEKALLRDARNSSLNIYLVEKELLADPAVDETESAPLLEAIGKVGMIALQIPVKNEEGRFSFKVVFVTDKKQKEMTDPLLKEAVPFDEDLYMSYRDHKILIIEDNPVALMLQKSIVSEFGVCDTVEDGASGLDLLNLALEEKSPYSIVLLDLVMPGLSGAEVLRKIREEEGKRSIKGLDRCKVIVSTTTRESSTLMELFRAEADAYIIKPMTRDKIVKELKELKLI